MKKQLLRNSTFALTVLLAVLCVLANANASTSSTAHHLRREDGEARAQRNSGNEPSVLQSTVGMPQHATLLTQTRLACPTSTSFTIDISYSSYTDALAQDLLINFAFDCQTQLEQLVSFNFYAIGNQLTSINSIYYVTRTMKNLVELNIYVTNNQINNAGLNNVQNMFQYNPLLQRLFIDLKQNLISDLYPFKFAFNSLSKLTSLRLFFNNNQITDVAFASTAFYSLTGLQSLELDVDENIITSAAPLAYAFDKLLKLESIILSFFVNRLTSLDFLRTAFQKLTALKVARLDLDFNQIVDVSPLETAFDNNNALQSFTLWLNSNQISQGIDQLIDGIQLDVGARKAFCPFYFNINYNQLTSTQKQRLGLLQTNLQSTYQTTSCQERDFQFYYY